MSSPSPFTRKCHLRSPEIAPGTCQLRINRTTITQIARILCLPIHITSCSGGKAYSHGVLLFPLDVTSLILRHSLTLSPFKNLQQPECSMVLRYLKVPTSTRILRYRQKPYHEDKRASSPSSASAISLRLRLYSSLVSSCAIRFQGLMPRKHACLVSLKLSAHLDASKPPSPNCRLRIPLST